MEVLRQEENRMERQLEQETMADRSAGRDGTENDGVVQELLMQLREERQRRYGVTTIGQLERLYKLSSGAEEAGQFSAAINAEKIRSALGGLTVDRREQINTIDQMSRDEITARLAALQKQYPQAFVIEGTAKDITPDEQGAGGEFLELIEDKPSEELLRDKD